VVYNSLRGAHGELAKKRTRFHTRIILGLLIQVSTVGGEGTKIRGGGDTEQRGKHCVQKTVEQGGTP